MDYNEILRTEYYGNTVLDYIWLIGLILAGLIFRKYISGYLAHLIFKLFKRKSLGVPEEQLNKLLVRPMNLLIILLFVFLATRHIHPPTQWDLAPVEEFGLLMFISKAYALLVTIAVLYILLRITDYLGLVFMARAENTESKFDDQIVPFLVDGIKFVLVVLWLFFVLDSIFKVDITALIAGLGIGGIALALAAKDSLENLLGSVTIFFDQPFKVGDMVNFGGTTGVVEKVGFRSTRLRTLDKTYVTVPNRMITNTELDNYSERTHRRSNFTIGLVYGTTEEQISGITSDLKDLLLEHPMIDEGFEVRFKDFGASSLDIMVIYNVRTIEWSKYLEVREEINFKIMGIVEKHGSSFAFPSTSVYLEKN
jgi:MscS family membrane protein